jgi:membrane protease subunit HflC
VKTGPFIIRLAILILVGYNSFYVVDETEQVVITQFGKPIGESIREPGLKFKIPYYTATVFPKNLLEWDAEPGHNTYP